VLGGRTKDGHRVVERLGSGIPAVLDALRLAGLAPPIFHDLGVRFSARVVARTPASWVRYALRALRQAAVVHTERLDGRTDRFVLTSTEQATG